MSALVAALMEEIRKITTHLSIEELESFKRALDESYVAYLEDKREELEEDRSD